MIVGLHWLGVQFMEENISLMEKWLPSVNDWKLEAYKNEFQFKSNSFWGVV